MRTIQPMDLRKFCRDSDRMYTDISVNLAYREQPWLRLGQCNILQDRNISMIKAYLGENTDAEHDSAYIVSFEVVGLTFKMYTYGTAHFEAWIRADEPNSFRVPTAEYDPLASAASCRRCKGDDAHKIVDYMPPENPELYNLVRGCKIKIVTGIKSP